MILTFSELEKLLNVSASTSLVENHTDLLSCYLRSAYTLHTMACKGITGNSPNDMKHVTKEIWNEHLITSFYLYRHSIELGLKGLLKKIKDVDYPSHDLKKLWDDYIPQNYQKILSDKVSPAFIVLEKFKVLKNEQLFRYHIENVKKNAQSSALKNLPEIKYDDFAVLLYAALDIRGAVLCCSYTKNKTPEKDM